MSNLLLAVLLSLGIISTQDVVREMAVREDVNPRLSACIVTNESNWNPMCRGALDERGLYQLLPSTAIWAATKLGWDGFELDDLDDQVKNAEMGTWILKHYPAWYSTIEKCEGVR